MRFDKVKNKGKAQLFKNPVLEALTQTRPWVIYLIYIPLCVWMLFYSYSFWGLSAMVIAKVFVMALLSWTLFEYIAHRYLFHYNPKSKVGERIIYIFHGNHHEYPRDKNRLFMPPVPSVLFAFVLMLLFSAVSVAAAGTVAYAFSFFPGFIIGYLVYVSMHYAIHAFPPPKQLKTLWRNHHLHHYKYPEKGFGVSSSFWDVIFGTVPRKETYDYRNETEA